MNSHVRNLMHFAKEATDAIGLAVSNLNGKWDSVDERHQLMLASTALSAAIARVEILCDKKPKKNKKKSKKKSKKK